MSKKKENNVNMEELEGKSTDELLKEVYKLLKEKHRSGVPSKVLGAVSIFGKGIKHGIKVAAKGTVNSFKKAAAAEEAEAAVKKAKKEEDKA